MGFLFKKSIKVGPVRVNVSKSGVGVSAGVKGARIGINSKGKVYGSAGVKGLTYRTQLSGAKKQKKTVDNETENVIEITEMQKEKRNEHTDANAGVVIGMLMIVFSFVVVVFNTNAGLVGIVVGLVVLIVSGIFAAARKNTAGWLRAQIVKNAQLSETEVEHYIADYCERKKLSAEETTQTMAALLQERAEYQSSAREQFARFADDLGFCVVNHSAENEQESPLDIADMAFQEVMKNQPQAAVSKNHYTLFYTDFNGNETRREIDFKEFLNDGKLYIKAWCHLRSDFRQFDICRIERLLDCAGKEIPDPEGYFRQLYENSDEYKAAAYFELHSDELKALVFLARADGQMRKNEREVIADYVRRKLPDVSADVLDSHIKACSCEFSEFQKLIKLLAEKSAETKNALVDSAEQIYSLKKSPDAIETGIFQKIQELRK